MTAHRFLDDARGPFPFCPGCSHGGVLEQLDAAMTRLGWSPHRVVVVTDIGCVGLSDQWFQTHAFHGLHGRSVLYGQGLKLANPDLNVVVLMGDGGAGIGGHHLLHAAKRNVDLTVVLFNNLNYGMTGGEHSSLTPNGARTRTTPWGNPEAPLRIPETLALNGAAYVARRACYDPDLVEVLERALATAGFALVEVLEFCTAYYVPGNRFHRRAMEDLMERGPFPRYEKLHPDRATYAQRYAVLQQRAGATPPRPLPVLEPRFRHALRRTLRLVVAGSAGMSIRTAADLIARAAILSGLYAVQRDDYPVTVRTGYSLAYLILAPEPPAEIGFAVPDVLVLVSTEGQQRARPLLQRMNPEQRVYILDHLPEVATAAQVFRIDAARLARGTPLPMRALKALVAVFRHLQILPVAALTRVLEQDPRREIREQGPALVAAADAGLVRPAGTGNADQAPRGAGRS